MSCAPVWMMRLILGTLDYYVPRVIRSNTVEQFAGVVHEVIGPHASPRLPRNTLIIVNVRHALPWAPLPHTLPHTLCLPWAHPPAHPPAHPLSTVAPSAHSLPPSQGTIATYPRLARPSVPVKRS